MKKQDAYDGVHERMHTASETFFPVDAKRKKEKKFQEHSITKAQKLWNHITSGEERIMWDTGTNKQELIMDTNLQF